MNRIYIPSDSPDKWKGLLAQPNKQWKKSYSARSLAYCWQEADGFPKTILKTFQNSKISLFKNMELLFAFPEYKVSLPGGKNLSKMGNLSLLTKKVDGMQENEVLFRVWLNIIFMMSFDYLTDIKCKSSAGYYKEKERLLLDVALTISLLQKH